jgi:starvation-inducible DNA-binding protein
MMRLTYTLSEKVCARTSELLNRHLAAAIDPQGQLKQRHRNVHAPTFIAVHELFDGVAREAERYSYLIAEHTAGLGAVAEGQTRSRRNELSLSCPLRIADAETDDFFTEIWPGIDDRLWFVESRATRIWGKPLP